MAQYFRRKYPLLQCYLVTHIQLISWIICFASGKDEFLWLLPTAFMLTSLFWFGFTQTEFPEVPATRKTLTLCRWRWPRMIFLTQLRLPTNLGRDWWLSNEVAWLVDYFSSEWEPHIYNAIQVLKYCTQKKKTFSKAFAFAFVKLMHILLWPKKVTLVQKRLEQTTQS